MATQNPVSTISYNTEAFLLEKLETLISNHTIQCYQYIQHIGEDGDKDHIHLRIEPNKRIDVMNLTDMFKEYKVNEDKPLGCRPWRPSKEEDWFLYVVHDRDYLKLKYGGGEQGEKIEYHWSDIVVSNDYDLEIAFIRAKQSFKHTSSNLAKQIQEGTDFYKLIQEGENPFTINAIRRAVEDSQYTKLLHDFNELQASFTELELYNEKLINAISKFGAHVVISKEGDVELLPGRKDF